MQTLHHAIAVTFVHTSNHGKGLQCNGFASCVFLKRRSLYLNNLWHQKRRKHKQLIAVFAVLAWSIYISTSIIALARCVVTILRGLGVTAKPICNATEVTVYV